MKAIEILKNFVEEKLSIEELEMALYSNQELISLLENTKAKPYMNSNSTYEYLISQDLTSIDAKLNLLDIFREILDYKHIPYSSNSTTEKNFDLILEAIPNWIPADMGYLNSLYDKYKPKTINERSKEIRAIQFEKTAQCWGKMSPMINVLILVCMVDVLKQRLSVKGQISQMLPIWKSLEN